MLTESRTFYWRVCLVLLPFFEVRNHDIANVCWRKKGNQFLVDLLAPNLDPLMFKCLPWWNGHMKPQYTWISSRVIKRMSFLPVYHGESLLSHHLDNIFQPFSHQIYIYTSGSNKTTMSNLPFHFEWFWKIFPSNQAGSRCRNALGSNLDERYASRFEELDMNKKIHEDTVDGKKNPRYHLGCPKCWLYSKTFWGHPKWLSRIFFLEFHETILAISGFSCSESMGMISASVVFYRFMRRLASSVVIRSGRCMLHMHMICT